MSDKEFLEQIEIREKLKSKGFSRVKCDKCTGGLIFNDSHLALMIPPQQCFFCEGQGYRWIEEKKL